MLLFILILLLGLFSPFFVNAQLPGYIVTAEGDTLTGQIQYNTRPNVPEEPTE